MNATVDLTNQLDKVKRREKELQKTIKKMEEKIRKMERRRSKALGSPTSQSELSNEARQVSSAEKQSQEEQDCIEVCVYL